MESTIVRYNKTDKYFRFEFNFYNCIEAVYLVPKEHATPLQRDGNVLKLKKGILNLSEIRYTEVCLFIHVNDLKNEITAEQVEAPVEPLLTKNQLNRMKKEWDEWSGNK